jgi:hypothetical protein
MRYSMAEISRFSSVHKRWLTARFVIKDADAGLCGAA